MVIFLAHALAATSFVWVGLEDDVATLKSFESVFANILNIATPLVGILIFIMIIIGGFKLLTSSGNPEQVKKATGNITWAIVGLVLLIIIWFIFRFIEQFTGIKITEFEIPGP